MVKRETDPDSQDPPAGIDDFYDAANRPITEGQNVGAGNKTFNFTYNGDLPDMTTYPGGAQVQQTYTNRRQLYAVNLAAPGEQQLTPQAWHEYDPAGRLTMRHRANNTETLWEYDANSRVTHIAHQAAQGGPIFQAWTYAYTDAGNPLAQKDTTPNLAAWGEAYRYDQMNRLIDAKRGPVDANNNVPVLDILFRQQWDLTKVGDWEQWIKSQQGEQDVVETREHNDLHSLLMRTIDQQPAQTLTYDANGNLVDDGEQFKFEYDANDKLCRVRNRVNNAIVAEYRYDVFGRRVEKDVKAGNPKGAPVGITRYYYTGRRIAEERDGNDVVWAFYTYGHYIDEPLTMDRWNGESFTRHFYHQNRMFSTYALTGNQGEVVERYAYTAYGECKTYAVDYTSEQSASRVNNPFIYTGQLSDNETGVLSYKARIYGASLGRFLQLDPIGIANDGPNLYQYVRGQPTRYRDPSGLACSDQCVWGTIKDVKADDVQLKAASSPASPAAVAAAKNAVMRADLIGKISSLAQAGAGAAVGAKEFAEGVVQIIAETAVGAGTPANEILKKIDEIAKDINKQHGVVIWVHVTYSHCEWTRCWPWCWDGANDWVTKDTWHRCSAEAADAPLAGAVGQEGAPLSAGFRVEDNVGIAAAIPECIREAVNAVAK